MLGEKVADIFNLVKSNFTYVSDESQYGLREAWVQPDEFYDGTQPVKGDCEDFAMACRCLLSKANIFSRLVICTTETGELHCIVVVEGKEGAFNTFLVLDNRMDSVVTKAEMERNYTVLKISDYSFTGKWYKVGAKT